jgi:hypothetical protein
MEKFNCPNCGQEINIEESQVINGTVQCPLCQKTVNILSPIKSNLEPVSNESICSQTYYVPGSIKKMWNLLLLFMLVGFIIIPILFLVWDILNGPGPLVPNSYNLQINFVGISILVLSVVNFLCMIISIIIASILLYRFWNIIQKGNITRTTPGKAVGFTFIPIFNLYWFYVAYIGLAKDMNAYCDENNINVRFNESLALSWYILTLLSAIPLTGVITGIIAFILYLVMMKKFSELSEIIISTK